MPVRLPRWAWWLLLPMLVGGLLLMHGIDVHASESHAAVGASQPATTAGASAYHGSTDPDHDQHCSDCLASHVMVACVAVVATIAIVALARRVLARACSVVRARARTGHAREPVERARPPDPAWVRLTVMRC